MTLKQWEANYIFDAMHDWVLIHAKDASRAISEWPTGLMQSFCTMEAGSAPA